MKRGLSILFLLSIYYYQSNAQVNIDTLAFQDFEVSPASPTWNFTGPVVYNSGSSSASAAPPNSPIGIGGSRAWETTTNSSGLILTFDNVNIPSGYDSVRFHFNLAAMNLNSSSGGPDHLDYVLTEVSTNGGTSYFNRLRIRGAAANNSFWAYSATGVASVPHLPMSEVMFQPTNTGLQTTLGYSNCEIVFPGSVTQVRIRMTGRSSSSSDTWLIDNVILTGEKYCSNTTSSITETACDSFMAPSGVYFDSSGVFTDVIPNSAGCDSIITINLTINKVDTSVSVSGPTLTSNATSASYQWLDCDNGMSQISGATSASYTASANGNYAVALVQSGCLDTSACYSVVGIGIDSKNREDQVKIFPNPTSSLVNVELEEIVGDVTLELRDLNGKVLMSRIYSGGKKLIQIDLNQPSGMYLLNVINESKHLSVPLVIVN